LKRVFWNNFDEFTLNVRKIGKSGSTEHASSTPSHYQRNGEKLVIGGWGERKFRTVWAMIDTAQYSTSLLKEKGMHKINTTGVSCVNNW
jgi:hypothetical protein